MKKIFIIICLFYFTDSFSQERGKYQKETFIVSWKLTPSASINFLCRHKNLCAGVKKEGGSQKELFPSKKWKLKLKGQGTEIVNNSKNHSIKNPGVVRHADGSVKKLKKSPYVTPGKVAFPSYSHYSF